MACTVQMTSRFPWIPPLKVPRTSGNLYQRKESVASYYGLIVVLCCTLPGEEKAELSHDVKEVSRREEGYCTSYRFLVQENVVPGTW